MSFSSPCGGAQSRPEPGLLERGVTRRSESIAPFRSEEDQLRAFSSSSLGAVRNCMLPTWRGVGQESLHDVNLSRRMILWPAACEPDLKGGDATIAFDACLVTYTETGA
jgi:hypothetical protein